MTIYNVHAPVLLTSTTRLSICKVCAILILALNVTVVIVQTLVNNAGACTAHGY